MIIAISGIAGVGKDYVADKLAKALPKSKKIAFADALRSELSDLNSYIEGTDDALYIESLYHVTGEQLDHLLALQHHNIYIYEGKRPCCYRDVMQYWGTDVRRKQNPTYWIDKTKDKIKELQREGISTVILTDARFANELAIADLTVRLEDTPDRIKHRLEKRDGGKIMTAKESSHPSETALNTADFDLIFHRNLVSTDSIINTIKSNIE